MSETRLSAEDRSQLETLYPPLGRGSARYSANSEAWRIRRLLDHITALEADLAAAQVERQPAEALAEAVEEHDRKRYASTYDAMMDALAAYRAASASERENEQEASQRSYESLGHTELASMCHHRDAKIAQLKSDLATARADAAALREAVNAALDDARERHAGYLATYETLEQGGQKQDAYLAERHARWSDVSYARGYRDALLFVQGKILATPTPGESLLAERQAAVALAEAVEQIQKRCDAYIGNPPQHRMHAWDEVSQELRHAIRTYRAARKHENGDV